MKYKKWLAIGVLLAVALIPIIISQIIKLPFGSKTIGNEDAWVSFFGSYIGGVVSALGVIVTTYFLIESNKKATEYAADLQDKQIREREYTTFVLNQIEKSNQLLNQCTKLIYKDVNLMRMLGEGLNDVHVFKRNNLGDFEKQDQEMRVILLDRHDKIVNEYRAIKKEEEEVRFEVIEHLGNLRLKTVFIQEITDEIDGIENAINSNAKEIMEYYNDYIDGEALPETILDEFRSSYLEKVGALESKLNQIAIELLNDYKKTP